MTTKKSTKSAKNIWFISREYGHLAGVGGVKDVVKQLAAALARDNHQVNVVLPLYGFINPKKSGYKKLTSFAIELSYAQEERREQVTIWYKRTEINLFLVDSSRFRAKKGVYTYTAAESNINPLHQQGSGHVDYFAMNVLHQKAALALMVHLNKRPDIIHCHDGHTALLPAIIRETEGYRHYFNKTGCVLTIHNAGTGYHQEVADLPFAKAVTGLPTRVIEKNILADAFDPLLAAAPYALLNTVSENYAKELQEGEEDILTGGLGHRLKELGIRLEGVTNGIDPSDYDLNNYQALGLAAKFTPGSTSPKKIAGKLTCRQDLLTDLATRKIKGLKKTGILYWQPDLPLFTFVGRFTAQKGINILLDALKKLLPIEPNFQILILGSGQKTEEEALKQLTKAPKNRGRICLLRGYDLITANRIFAAGNFFLIPSQYEPCGLTDFQAQLFGNLPIVHTVGGLVKVIDNKTGFTYNEHSGKALQSAMLRAIRLFEAPHGGPNINRMQRAALTMINKKYTWDVVMKRYLKLYKQSTMMAS